jgi:uncharacterized protein (DUF2062 family)
VFKRRNPRSYSEIARSFVYPRGGFRRATQYVLHRMRRLPDEPHRIARGVFAGIFVSFPPLFGVQMLSAGLLAWAIRGNILASLLATFMSNPLTTPFIAVGSLELGHWMLGIHVPLDFVSIVAAFADAGSELWRNFKALFTSAPTHWDSLGAFFHIIYWPYLVGSIIPGIVISFVFYFLTIPLIKGYQRLRKNRTVQRIEKRRSLKALVIEADARAAAKAADETANLQGDDDTG